MSSAFRDELLARFRWIGGHGDVLGLLADADVLRGAVDALAEPFADERVAQVTGIEARGFVLAAAVAARLGAGFVAVRKPGSVHPGPKAVRPTAPDWRRRRLPLEMQRHAVPGGSRVLLVDDWAETGSQALAARALVEDCGGTWVGASLLVDQLQDDVRAQLDPVRSVVRAWELPPNPGWATRWQEPQPGHAE